MKGTILQELIMTKFFCCCSDTLSSLGLILNKGPSLYHVRKVYCQNTYSKESKRSKHCLSLDTQT